MSTQTNRFTSILTILVTVALTAIVISTGMFIWQQSMIEKKQVIEQLLNAQVANTAEMEREQQELIRESQKQIEIAEKDFWQTVDSGCQAEDCLVGTRDYFIGTTVLKGYYEKTTQNAWGEEKQCDSFILIEHSAKFKEYYDAEKNAGKYGSEFNQSLIVDLGLDLLNEKEKNRLIQSDSSNPVDLLVLRPSFPDVGLPVCYPVVEVLRVLEK